MPKPIKWFIRWGWLPLMIIPIAKLILDNFAS